MGERLRWFGAVRDILAKDGSLYLRRIYLCPWVYLHYIAAADADRHLHNHPWLWCRSLILTGGYVEERLEGRFLRSAGSWVRLNETDYHRISYVRPRTWTLFIHGRRLGSWGFLWGDKHVDHERYASLFRS